MPKWIDLKDREPKHGQLVVVRGKPYADPEFPHSENTDIKLATWGIERAWPYNTTEGATHWYPLPALHEYTDPDRERLRKDYPEILTRCTDIEKYLRTIAPLIEWRVMPDVEFDRVVPRFNYAWKIRGSVEVNGLTLNCEHTVTDELLRRAGDYLDHVVRWIANGFAQEMVK